MSGYTKIVNPIPVLRTSWIPCTQYSRVMVVDRSDVFPGLVARRKLPACLSCAACSPAMASDEHNPFAELARWEAEWAALLEPLGLQEEDQEGLQRLLRFLHDDLFQAEARPPHAPYRPYLHPFLVAVQRSRGLYLHFVCSLSLWVGASGRSVRRDGQESVALLPGAALESALARSVPSAGGTPAPSWGALGRVGSSGSSGRRCTSSLRLGAEARVRH